MLEQSKNTQAGYEEVIECNHAELDKFRTTLVRLDDKLRKRDIERDQLQVENQDLKIQAALAFLRSSNGDNTAVSILRILS